MALPNRARSTRLLVVALVSICLATITLDYREGDHGPLAAGGRAAITVIGPLQETVSKVTHPVGNFFSTLVRLPAIRRENELLKERVAALESQIGTAVSDERRLHELEALLDVQQSLGPNVRTVGAQVIANGASNFEWTITIDKGSSDGVRVDDPVVAAGKQLVGHVVRVGPDASMVQLLVDPDSAVAGRLETSGKTGLVTGQGNQDMRMGLIDTTTDVQAGEQVVTAAYRIPGVAQSLYPPGVLIGTVSRVLPDEAALEKYITVSPAVDVSSLDIVLVVLPDGGG
ncbi:MAG TPA: rod shape-determining protein MreC [Actinomycetota bacterium]|nr:rod shape-determining protein MreC [Actinomycetota bacterium]